MTTRIDPQATLDGFFEDLVRDALASEKVSLDEPCVLYLAKLCAEFARNETLFGADQRGEPGTPALVSLYQRAQSADRGLRFHAYRHLGDVSLVVSGLFTPHIERARSLVGVDYYVQMGAAAYDSASTLARPTGFSSVLSRLAAEFRRLVEVLTRVAEQTTLPVARDVAALYERFFRLPESEELRRRLLVNGAIPVLAVVGARS